MPKQRRTFKQLFFHGIILLFPTLITIFVLSKVWNLLNTTIGQFLSGAVLYSLKNYMSIDTAYLESELPLVVTVIGFSLATLIVLLIGVIVATFIGRGLFQYVEKLLATIPVIKVIYPYAKQVTDFFASQSDEDASAHFAGVVAVEYPRRGMYSLGFVTGNGVKILAERLDTDIIHLFMPSSPTPITGYVIFVPRHDTVELDMTVEDALRFIVSGGVLIPAQQVVKEKRLDGTQVLRIKQPDTIKSGQSKEQGK